ncbi:MAG: hypothetical protein U0835_10915 [Isosphaeraceae bacterium]
MKNLPTGLTGMAVLILLVESWMGRHADDITTAASANVRLSARLARAGVPGVQIYCLGDSLSKYGVASPVLRERTGRSAYNLANIAARAPTTYLVLQRLLASGVRPEAVLVDFEPSLLQRDPRTGLGSVCEAATLADCVELGWSACDAGLLARAVCEWLLLSARNRLDVRSWVMAALKGGGSPARASILPLWRNWNVNGGTFVTSRRLNAPDPPLAPWHLEVPWRRDPLNEAYVRKFFELTGRHGIATFLLGPPFSPRMHAERERRGLDEAYTRYLSELRARYPHVTVIDGRGARYDPTYFVDSVHLDRRGATAFTEDVADVLNERLSRPGVAPGWVSLPVRRRPPSESPLEDVTQSAIALSRSPAAAASARR